MKKDYYVYGLLRPEDKGTNKYFYIGKGKGNRNSAIRGRNSFVRNICKKHGGHWTCVIADNLCEKIAFAMEKKLIAYYRPEANMTDGGEGTSGYQHTEEHKAKMKGNKYGHGNKNALGNKHTAEAKARISAANKGNKYGLGNRSWLGKTHTAEAKARISAANKGNKNALGHKQSAEHIAKCVSARLKNKNL